MSHFLAFSVLAAAIVSPSAQDDEAEKRLDKLFHQLKDSDIKVRMNAAVSIGNLGDKVRKRAIPALRDVLLDANENFNVQDHAMVAIQKMGRAAHPVLVECATKGTAFVRRSSTEALGGMGSQAVPTLVAALKDPDRKVRRIAIRSLGRIGPAAKSAIPALEAATRDVYDYVAIDAARTLWQIANGDTAKKTSIVNGPTDRGLGAFLSSPQKTFQVGEPILLNYGVIFLGDGKQSSARVWRPHFAVDPNNGSWFEVVGPGGKKLKYHGIFVSIAYPKKASAENSTVLHSGEFIGRKDYDLTTAFNLTQPGQYTVRWNYQPVGSGAWTGKLQSNEFKITIIKLKPADSTRKSR